MWLKMNHLHCRREFVSVKSVERERDRERSDGVENKQQQFTDPFRFGWLDSIFEHHSTHRPCTVPRVQHVQRQTDSRGGFSGIAQTRESREKRRKRTRKNPINYSSTDASDSLARWNEFHTFSIRHRKSLFFSKAISITLLLIKSRKIWCEILCRLFIGVVFG